MQWCKVVLALVSLSVCLCVLLVAAQQERPRWQYQGCHLVGYSKLVKIAGCREVRVSMNACRGYCETYSILAPYDAMTDDKVFLSGGSCCSIADTHDVIVTIPCENNLHIEVTFRSARTCQCSLCAQDDPPTADIGTV